MTTLADLPDLASRAYGGSVVSANDEFFAERENLIKPDPPAYSPATFGHKGQIYDGWETRRRRDPGGAPGHDFAVVRLGLPGIVHGVVVDTAHFTGNYPPFVSVEACGVEGYPAPEELADAAWTTVVPKSPVQGDVANAFEVGDEWRFTHVRLSIYPDGGVARLRVPGEVVPDPRFLPAVLDLAALENGGRVTGCSNLYFSSPTNLIAPGPARSMGDGWETARRRDDGNDWVVMRLAGPGVVRLVELDTTHFKGNAPGWASLRGRTAADREWFDLLPRTRLQPDTPHRFLVAAEQVATEVRLDVFPDGGLARLRVHGTLVDEGRRALTLRWFNALPVPQAEQVLADGLGISGAGVDDILGGRPFTSYDQIPHGLR